VGRSADRDRRPDGLRRPHEDQELPSSSFTLLRQVGVNHANNPNAAFIPDLDERRLAEILRVPVEEIARRRHLARPEAGYVDFFGTAVRADEIIVRTVRFAPAALAASPHNRALWSLKTVPCCTETWQYLTSDCSCGARQRWQHADAFDRCHSCNRRLDRLDADLVPEDERAGLAALVGLLDPDVQRRADARLLLPASLSDWDGGMVFELAIALMPLVEDPYRLKRTQSPPPDQLRRYARALAQTADLIQGWPGSFVPALHRAVDNRSRSRRNVRYTGIADYIPALESDILPAIVSEAIHEQLAPISSPAGETPSDQIAMMDAVDHVLMPLGMLAKGRRDGHLQSHISFRANRLFPTLDRAEVEALRDQRDNRRSAEAVSHSSNSPVCDSAHRRQGPYRDAGAPLPSFPLRCATDGRARGQALPRRPAFRFCAPAPDGETACEDAFIVPLHRVARAIGGGFKPWGVIFDRLLRKDNPVPFTLAGKSISRIKLRQEDADAMRAIAPLTTLPSSLLPLFTEGCAGDPEPPWQARRSAQGIRRRRR
jgi:hypothetical protein